MRNLECFSAHGVSRLAVAALFAVVSLSSHGNAQQFPDTIWVPVTFYDFHADGSNPEFEVNHTGDLKTGMVADTLSADRKPVIGKSPFFNYYIHKWFRPYNKGDFTVPTYTDLIGTYGGITKLDHDTAFKNIVIQDSLPFLHLGNGMYQFERSGQNNTTEFFWIDRKGFGNEPSGRNHNFSFTMELHTQFTYQKGLVFQFLGDDDVWAFVGGKLAMDLGGIHKSEAGSFNVDNFAGQMGFVSGRKYDFDFFYAERHTTNSTIKITTNLFTPPAFLRLYPVADPTGQQPYGPTVTQKAGEPFQVYAHVFDSTFEWQKDKGNNVTWELIDTTGKTVLSSSSGNGTSFTPTEAYTSLTLIARYKDPANPTAPEAVSSITITVGPGAPDHINIQTTPEIKNYRDDDDVGQVTLDEMQRTTKLYAVIRDKYGNYVGMADNAVWQSQNPQVATVLATTGKKSEATVTKAGGGSTQITATQGGLTGRVTLTMMSSLVGLTSAVTRDVNGDGFLDRIELVFDSTVTISREIAMLGIKVSNGSTNFTIENITGKNNTTTDRTFYVTLKEQTGTELQTGWTPSVSVSGIENVANQTVVAQDGAGPVVKTVQYFIGQSRSESSPGTSDTLRITLSEAVDWPDGALANTTFRYFKETNGVSDALATILSKDGGSGTAVVTVRDGFEVTPNLDSIQLLSTSNVKDLSGNTPPENGRKAPVDWGAERLTVIPSTNPFVPGVTQIPEPVRRYYAGVLSQAKSDGASSVDITSGVLVGIEVRGKPLKVAADGVSFGSWIIYDAVGNVVASGKLYKAQPQSIDYGGLWDGKNSNGRYVGRGAYLMVITATDIEGKKKTERVKVGVKR